MATCTVSPSMSHGGTTQQRVHSRGGQSPERGRGRGRRRRSQDRGAGTSRSRSRHSEHEEEHQDGHSYTHAHASHTHTPSQSHSHHTPTSPPTLFPSSPLPLSSLEGSWTLIASTASMWQARRGVTMTIADPSSSSFAGPKRPTRPLQATWTFYELGSFKPKTLLQRIREYQRAKQAARDQSEDQEQRPGENKESQSGIVSENDEHM